MTFAQINLKGKVIPGTSEPLNQTNVVFRLDKVLDITTNSTLADQFLIQLQDAGEACTSSLILKGVVSSNGKQPFVTSVSVTSTNPSFS